MINREHLLQRLNASIGRSKITALLGPRQCGKTTLARLIAKKNPSTYFDLESPQDLSQLQNPQLALSPLKGLIIIDEIQKRPDLFAILRVLADRRPVRAKFLILGSASPAIIRNASESLAGRIEFIEIGGFDLSEVGDNKKDRLWLRGGFPESFLAKSDTASFIWREQFIRTFIERDIPQLGYQIPSPTLQRFWSMLSHAHGQIWNGMEIGSSLGISHTSARRYLDLLIGAFVIRQLLPWHENIGKRLVKSPKIYFKDSGLLHNFLGLQSMRDLQSHPKLGFSWEGFALHHVLNHFGESQSFFWATHSGAELDLLLIRGKKRLGFEFKYSENPQTTKSMQIAIHDLHLNKLFIVYPGKESFLINDKIECVTLSKISSL